MVLDKRNNGLLLVIMTGLLTLLLILAVFFSAMSRTTRTTTSTQTDAVRAKLLARSGMEYAVARMSDQPDPQQNPDDDWTYRDDPAVPLEKSLNPSYHDGEPWDDTSTANGRYDPEVDGWDKETQDLNKNGRYDGWSGRLRGTHAAHSDRFKLRMEEANSKIHINDGILTAADTNGNGIPDHRDAEVMRETSGRQPPPNANWRPVGDWTEDGPNGFLVRLLNNLEQVVTETDSPTLGETIIENRPVGGYRGLDQLESILLGAPSPGSASSIRRFLPYLTTLAWVDPKVVKPQPVNGRPLRWIDIDEAHRQDGERTVVNEQGGWDGVPSVEISWKRDFLYAYKQLRLGTTNRLEDAYENRKEEVALQPRAPIALRNAPEEVLAAQMTGVSGTYLYVWESNLGFDSGFGFEGGQHSYDYPNQETTDSPWIRTRVDYGAAYGTVSRPWYGTAQGKEKALDWPGPLGELRDTVPIFQGQAMAASSLFKEWMEVVPEQLTWPIFELGVGQLPLWEDVEEDGLLDGAEYSTVNGMRKQFTLEDANRNGKLDLQRFDLYGEKGLTPQQKDVLRAMANPNTDLNDFNPDANLWKWVDKTDLLNHTVELSLVPMPFFRIESLGMVISRVRRASSKEKEAEYLVSGILQLFDLHRDTTQADFMQEWTEKKKSLQEVFSGTPAPYELVGGQPLVSYPEPQEAEWISVAKYDGQIGLAGIVSPDPLLGGVRSDMFSSMELQDVAGGDLQVLKPDIQGPYKGRLVGEEDSGNLFPDGVYSEKDHTPMYDLPFESHRTYSLWIKPNWFPQAATRPHMFFSGADEESIHTGYGDKVPLQFAPHPAGCYFVPARNNSREVFTYDHSHGSAAGKGWPTRSVLWGSPHIFAATAKPVHFYGIPDDFSKNRIERGKWFHLGLFVDNTAMSFDGEDGTLGPLTWGGQYWGGYGGESRTTLSGAHIRSRSSTFRLGELASMPNMNFCADSTYGPFVGISDSTSSETYSTQYPYLRSVARLGRYYKEGSENYLIERGGATFRGPILPFRDIPARVWVTWTAVPGFFDYEVLVGGAGLDANHYLLTKGVRGGVHTSLNAQLMTLEPTQIGVRIVQESQEETPELTVPIFSQAEFTDAGAENRMDLSPDRGAVHYEVIFRNQWTPVERLNNPLNETPFFDDITFRYIPAAGPRWLSFSEE